MGVFPIRHPAPPPTACFRCSLVLNRYTVSMTPFRNGVLEKCVRNTYTPAKMLAVIAPGSSHCTILYNVQGLRLVF